MASISFFLYLSVCCSDCVLIDDHQRFTLRVSPFLIAHTGFPVLRVFPNVLHAHQCFPDSRQKRCRVEEKENSVARPVSVGAAISHHLFTRPTPGHCVVSRPPAADDENTSSQGACGMCCPMTSSVVKAGAMLQLCFDIFRDNGHW